MNYQIQDVIFSIHHKHIIVDDHILALSTRGHLSLITLLQRENQIVSKDDLMTVLWPNVIVSDDSLFKVIQEVRQTLAQLGLDKTVLKNVYGKGYQLQDVSKIISQPLTKKWSLILPSIIFLLLMAISLVWFLSPPSQVIDDEIFQSKIKAIQAGQITVDLKTISLPQNALSSDLLKLNYLKGLQHYQSGEYEQSIKHLQQGIKDYNKDATIPALAHTYLLLCKIFIYRDEPELLQTYLTAAKDNYEKLQDHNGLLATAISQARFQQSQLLFEDSIHSLKMVIEQAHQLKQPFHVMRAYANLAYSYQQTHESDAQINALQETLNMALAQNDGRYVAFAYGELASVHMQKKQPVKAMKFAQQTLSYVLAQNETNIFQQGFSAYYNLLHELGHIQAAEKYLTSAINIQAHFNDKASLIMAEINLARALISQQKYQQSKQRLQNLLTQQLSQQQLLSITVLLALNSFHQKDNISAYTKAKEVYENDQSSPRIRLQAGVILTYAGLQLELFDQAQKIFTDLAQLVQPQWRFEYQQYLKLGQYFYQQYQIDKSKKQHFDELYQTFQLKQQTIKSQTQTPTHLAQHLDEYINNILE